MRLQQVFYAQKVREFIDILSHIFERSKEDKKYLQETAKETKNIDINVLKRYQKSYIEAPLRSVIDIINEKQNRNYLVILGGPGAGRSALLQFLALNWAESKLTNYFNQPIPILIELRIYAQQFYEKRCRYFLDYLHQALGTIQKLADNPLSLRMIAILNRYRELSRDRSTLYEKASEVLLQQWDAERHLFDWNRWGRKEV